MKFKIVSFVGAIPSCNGLQIDYVMFEISSFEAMDTPALELNYVSSYFAQTKTMLNSFCGKKQRY